MMRQTLASGEGVLRHVVHYPSVGSPSYYNLSDRARGLLRAVFSELHLDGGERRVPDTPEAAVHMAGITALLYLYDQLRLDDLPRGSLIVLDCIDQAGLEDVRLVYLMQHLKGVCERAGISLVFAATRSLRFADDPLSIDDE